MQVVHNKPILSEQEYLVREAQSEVKHEFIDGQLYAMAGASRNHSRLCANLLRHFGNHLIDSPCEANGPDLRVKAGESIFYPDVVVDCQFDESQTQYTQTPVLIVEVLSKSTRRTDLTTKRLRYINMPTLKEYVLVDQDIVQIEVLRRSDNWRSNYYFLGDEITFESLELTLTVEALYHRVNNEDMREFVEATR